MTSTLKEHGIALTEEVAHPSKSVNLRDLGSVTPLVQAGVIYRSSQVVSPTQLQALGIKSVLDLRQAPVACKSHVRNVRQSFGRGFSAAALWCKHTVLRKSAGVGLDPLDLLYDERALGMPAPCWRCTEACGAHYGCDAEVFHVDLLPGPVTLVIFSKLPFWLQSKVVYLTIRRAHCECVVAAAVADPSIMGYFKLYKIILQSAKRQVACAVRLFTKATAEAPLLVHCIHGKDRTGLIVMLVYLLMGVPRSVIVKDYSQSESLLREGREQRQLLGLQEALTTNEIMAAAASVMESTIDFLETKYGSAERYLRLAGLEAVEVDAIKERLAGSAHVDGALQPEDGAGCAPPCSALMHDT